MSDDLPIILIIAKLGEEMQKEHAFAQAARDVDLPSMFRVHDGRFEAFQEAIKIVEFYSKPENCKAQCHVQN